MAKVIILDENTANKIAAGEVIEKPASVIKELVENSIDSGASSISIEIHNGGISFIRVIDNGCGIDDDDVEISFERHATSKIRRAEDLDSVSSMGFRGEALASIAAVSDVSLSTRTKGALQGISIKIKGGCVTGLKPAGCPVGTSITIRDLFFNTPARYKFLKKDSTEARYTADVLSRIALGYPDISIKFVSNGKILFHTPGNGDLKSTLFSIYGAEIVKHLIEVNCDDENIKVNGYIGKAELSYSNRNNQSFYINRRFVKSKIITAALDAAYATFMMKNKYAFALLDVRINPAFVDVNVHPSKMEVKFSNEQDIYRAVYNAVSSTLLSGSSVRAPDSISKSGKKAFGANAMAYERPSYSQQSLEWITDELEKKRLEAIAGNQASDAAIIDESSYIKEDINYSNSTFTSDSTKNNKLHGLINNLKVVGQAFSTYIFLEHEDNIYLVDQHAAHERIMYEELKSAFANKETCSQILLEAIPVELPTSEYQFALSESAFMESLGYTYESFGTNSIILRSVPFDDSSSDIKEMFKEIIGCAMNSPAGQKISTTEEALYKIACKKAIKANKRLNEKEIGALLEKLSQLENPYTCPHGRPSILKISRYEVEKLFKRIV